MVNELLVKYIDIEEDDENFIYTSTYKGDVSCLIPLLEQSSSVLLEDGWYGFVYCQFRPAVHYGELDALYVYVEDYN